MSLKVKKKKKNMLPLQEGAPAFPKISPFFPQPFQGRSSTCVGESRGAVGEGEESQRAAHA